MVVWKGASFLHFPRELSSPKWEVRKEFISIDVVRKTTAMMKFRILKL